MRPIGCAATRRAAPELALDVLDGAERAEVLQHLGRCPRCLAYVAELAQVTDQLVGLAPDLEPPPRFARRVIGRITSRRRHANWRWAAAIAATVAAVIVVIAAAEILTQGAAHPVSAPPLRSVAMLAPGGVTVGQVVVAGGSPAQMAVSVNYAIPDGTYTLELVPPSMPGRELATITVAGGHGQWEGTTKVLGGHDTANLFMVGPRDTIVCRAAIT